MMARYTERVHYSLPGETKNRLKTRAAALGISMSELIRRISEKPDSPGETDIAGTEPQ